MLTTVKLLVVTWTVVNQTVAISRAQDPPEPLIQAHAHNDYRHSRPLLDALEQGFCSVEADVFLVRGKLLVAHARFEISETKALEDLYLKPLQTRVQQNGGRVYRHGPVFTLLIDIKSEGAAAYQALHHLLMKYRDMISHVEDGKLHEKAVTVIVSGDRPLAVIAADSLRFVGVDGRLSDLESEQPVHWLPLISDNWRTHFRWRGDGDMAAEEQQKLARIVKETHARGRRLRFWATPDQPTAWRVLQEAGVDLINTDDLPGLSAFLRGKGSDVAPDSK